MALGKFEYARGSYSSHQVSVNGSCLE